MEPNAILYFIFACMVMLMPTSESRRPANEPWLATFAAASAAVVLIRFERNMVKGATSNSYSAFGSADLPPWPASFPKQIPIGAVFDSSSQASRSAFLYEIDQHNNRTTTFKLDRFELDINMADSFELCKAMCQAMFDGIFVLYGVTTRRSSLHFVESFSRTFNVPILMPTYPPPQRLLQNTARPPTAYTITATMTTASPNGPPPLLKSLFPPSLPSSGSVGRPPPTSSSGGTGTTPTASSRDFTLFMRPIYRPAIVDLVRYYGWKRIYYIYDSPEGLANIEQMHAAINSDGIVLQIDSLRIPEVNRCHVILRHLDSRESSGVDKFIVLDMSSDAVLQTLLRQLQNVGMNRVNYHYLIGGLSFDELDTVNFRHGGANITGFRLVDYSQPGITHWNYGPDRTSRYGVGDAFTEGQTTTQVRRIQLEDALAMDAVKVMVRGLHAALTNFAAPSPGSSGVPSLTDILRRDRPVVRQQQYAVGAANEPRSTRGLRCKPGPPATWPYGSAIVNSLKQVRINGLTGPIEFDQNGHRKNYRFDVLEQRLDDEVSVKVATWDSVNGLRPDDTKPFANLTVEKANNRTRIITSIISHPYLFLRKPPEDGSKLTGNARFEGYCADLAYRLCTEYLKIDYRLELVKDNIFGVKMADGKWNGMIGELTRKEADIAIAPLTIMSQRERVIDFSKPFMQLGISIMIKKPEKQKPGVFSFMDPLSYKIWMCIIFSYLAVSIVLFLVSRFSSKEWQIEDSVHGPTFTNDFTILNSLWFSLGAFMRRGCDVCPRSMAGRVVGSAWWFFTLIIISSYTANLAAFLTIERMLTPIESADDLAKQTEIMYGTLNAGSTQNFFKASKIQVYEKMWNFMNSHPSVFVNSTEEGVKRVQSSKGRYAFLLESTMNDYYNQRKPCNTMKVGDNLDSKGYGIATPIHSELRSRINVAVLQMLEKEVLQKLQKKWWYDKGECVVETDNKGGSSQNSLSLSNVAGIFYILIGGLGLSLIVASFEYVYKSRLEASRQRKSFLDKSRSSSRCNQLGCTLERENGGFEFR